MKPADLEQMQVWLWAVPEADGGMSLVEIESPEHVFKLDAATLTVERAEAMRGPVQVVSNRTGRRIYLVRAVYAELVSVVLPNRPRS